MRLFVILSLLVLSLVGCEDYTSIREKPMTPRRSAAPTPAPTREAVQPAAHNSAEPVCVVNLTPSQIDRIGSSNRNLQKVIDTGSQSLGVPYKWGGASPSKGIDCSNFTWLTYRASGFPYQRFHGTRQMSTMTNADGLRNITFDQAKAGDLLIYGYTDARKKWHGHVVILIDKDGSATGHRGLALGAHGGNVRKVAFITYTGYDQGYYKLPQYKLKNVLRVTGVN